MGKYKNVWAWVAPIAIPFVVSGIRSWLKKNKNKGEIAGQQVEGERDDRELLDCMIETGLSSLTSGGAKGKNRYHLF